MEREERVERLRALLGSPVWSEVLAPELKEQLQTTVNHLVQARSTLDEPRLRVLLGEAARLQWLLTWPGSQVKEWDEEAERAREEAEAEARASEREEHYALYGAHSPVLPPEEAA